MNTTMKIFAGIAAAVATTVGVGVGVKKCMKNNTPANDETDLNNEIGSENFKDDPLYGTVIVNSAVSPYTTTTVYRTVTPEFFEEEFNKMTERMPITMCGDRTFNSYLYSLQDTGASISYYYVNKSKLDSFVDRISDGKRYNKFIIRLGSKILATNDGRYGDIITVSTEQSMGDEFNLHFVNIYGDWKFISYEQLIKDRNAAWRSDLGGTGSRHRLLRGVQVVALRDDTKEV